MTVNTSVTADHNAPAITRQLAEFVANHPSKGWSDAVEHEAHRTFLNWLGCAIGAARIHYQANIGHIVAHGQGRAHGFGIGHLRNGFGVDETGHFKASSACCNRPLNQAEFVSR